MSSRSSDHAQWANNAALILIQALLMVLSKDTRESSEKLNDTCSAGNYIKDQPDQLDQSFLPSLACV